MVDRIDRTSASHAQPPDRDAIAEQALRYLAGDLSADGVIALGRRLEEDPAAGDLFVRICLLDSWLSEKFAPGRREFMSEMTLDASGELRTASSFDSMVARVFPGDAGWDDDDDAPEPIELPPLIWPPPKPMVYDPWPRRLYALTAAMAAMILLTVSLVILFPRQAPVAKKHGVESRPPSVATAQAQAPIATSPTMTAVLFAGVGAEWATPHDSLRVGEPLPRGPLELKAGLAEVRFANGASLIIEAPARVDFHSDMRAGLLSGKLVATVPPAASGFAVETSATRLVDLGTEFGVEVDQGGATRVEVFRGKVQANAPVPPEISVASNAVGTTTQPTPEFQSRQLIAGEAGRVTPGTTVVSEAKAAALSFVRDDEFEAHAAAAAETASPYQRWLAYTYQLRHDPDLVAYYTFDTENKTNAPERLSNSSTAGPALDGVLTGDGGNRPTWVEGRWPQKAALAFASEPGNPGGAPRVLFPAAETLLDFSTGGGANGGDSRPFSIAVWVKARPIPAPGVGIVSRGREGASPWNLITESTFYRLALRGAADTKPSYLNSRNYRSMFWHHVVVTYDPGAEAARMYVDGAAVKDQAPGAGAAPRALASTSGPVMLGCRMDSSGKFVNPLIGTVDELIFFQRALTPDEVKRMYDAGKPD